MQPLAARDHEMRIADVAGYHLHRLHDVGGYRVQPAPGVEGVVQTTALTRSAARHHQFLDDMRADEAVATGDEDAGVLQIFHAGPQKAS